MLTTSTRTVRELDRRCFDGIDVQLLWNPSTNGLCVSVLDGRSGESFQLKVDAATALDAFRHPFAYTSGPPAHRALAA